MEEIEHLEQEIRKMCKQIDKEMEEVSKPKSKLSRQQKEDKVSVLLADAARAKDTYSSFRVELREILKEKGMVSYTEWEKKGHEHHRKIYKIQQELESLQKQIQNAPRDAGDRDAKDLNTWEAKEIIEEGKKVQGQSAKALARSQKLMEESETIAKDTNMTLKNHTEQMKATNADITEVSEDLRRANQVLRQISRRIASDKMIVCLILILILAILGLIIAKGMGKLSGGSNSSPIDCSLDFTKTTSACLSARATSAPISTPAPGGRRGSDTGSSELRFKSELLFANRGRTST